MIIMNRRLVETRSIAEAAFFVLMGRAIQITSDDPPDTPDRLDAAVKSMVLKARDLYEQIATERRA